MTVKVKLVNGSTEIFNTENYVLSKVKEMHPDILDCKVYHESGKLLAHRRRAFPKFYIKHIYKPLPPEPPKEST